MGAAAVAADLGGQDPLPVGRSRGRDAFVCVCMFFTIGAPGVQIHTHKYAHTPTPDTVSRQVSEYGGWRQVAIKTGKRSAGTGAEDSFPGGSASGSEKLTFWAPVENVNVSKKKVFDQFVTRSLKNFF